MTRATEGFYRAAKSARLEPGEIARALGGEVQGAHVLCPGPGHSKHDRSLSILIDPNAPDGFLIHSFAGDDWKLCRVYVLAGLGLKHARPESQKVSRSTSGGLRQSLASADKSRTDYALQLWRETQPIAGTLAERYLTSRGIILPADIDHVIRFHPDCPFGKGRRHPSMMALFSHIHTDAPCGIHRTALTPDCKKIDRKWLGECRDAAIKLSPDSDVSMGLGIAEGIETALSVMQAGWQPVWALGNAGAISRFPVLSGVDCLTVFADHDPPGIEAASACAERWQAAGREVRITYPQSSHSDFNDRIGERA